ncbi:MAG: aspartyl protease [Symploca sp. SIO2G7]|nr:aspartyl protease [Symploca sp. SIO2G7]
MLKPSFKASTLIVLSSILALGSFACGNNDADTANANLTDATPASPATSPTPAASPTPTPAASPTPTPKPKASPSPEPEASIDSDTYAHAMDIATGAITIGKSAVSRDDWSLVANQWQRAINLLKSLPTSDGNYANAQQRLPIYQRFMAEAKTKAAPPPEKPKEGDTKPDYFSVPIKGRQSQIPIIEVTFNGKQKFEMLFDTGASSTLVTRSIAATLQLEPIEFKAVGIADGSIVALPVALADSIEINGRFKSKVKVAIAPPAMPIGLLGQDFYVGYDVTIKENIIEFRRR